MLDFDAMGYYERNKRIGKLTTSWNELEGWQKEFDLNATQDLLREATKEAMEYIHEQMPYIIGELGDKTRSRA